MKHSTGARARRFAGAACAAALGMLAAANAAASTYTVHGARSASTSTAVASQASKSYTGAWRHENRTSQSMRPANTTQAQGKSASGHASSTTTAPTTRYQFTEVAPRSLW